MAETAAHRFVGYRCEDCGCTDVEFETWARFDLVRQDDVPTDPCGSGWWCPQCENHNAHVEDFLLEGVALAAAQEHKRLAQVRDTGVELLAALEAMLEVQSARRHPLGQPDEGIAYKAASAAAKARATVAKARGEVPS